MAVTSKPRSWSASEWQPEPAPTSRTRPRQSSSASCSRGGNWSGAAEEVGHRHLVPLEVVVDDDDRVVLTAVVGLHGRGMRLPGVQVHAVVTARQGMLVC